MKLNKKYNQISGFTLLEVIAASGFIVALGFGILALQKLISTGQNSSLNSSIAISQANEAAGEFAREIRTARASDNGSYTIFLADDNEIIFYSDIDYDNNAERVRYYLSGKEFRKEITEPSGNPPQYLSQNSKEKIITEFVENNSIPIFTYFNSEWPNDTISNPLSTPANVLDIRLIYMQIHINPTPQSAQTNYILETYAQIRTLKDNL